MGINTPKLLKFTQISHFDHVMGGVFKPVFSKTGFFEGFWTLEKTKKMAKNVLNFGAIGANKG